MMQYLDRIFARLASFNPVRRRSLRATLDCRRDALGFLDQWSRKGPSGEPAANNILVDGMWDNANYWVRYAMLRRALHLTRAKESGLLGKYSRKRVRAAFADQGIETLVDYHRQVRNGEAFVDQARALLTDTRTAVDILNWRLPNGFPAALVYDGLLKRQRRATVSIDDPFLVSYVAEALAYINVADQILELGNYNLIVLSHLLDYSYAALAWAAIERQVPVLVLYGDYGAARFIRVRDKDDLFAYPGRPSKREIEAMPKAAAAILTHVGRRQLEARINGNARDIGSIYAYKKRHGNIDRQSLCDEFGWERDRPIIAVYASNWFDFPHASGLHVFTDFLDWIKTTLSAARERQDVNWLFKPHPCDDWYPKIKGPRLDEIIVRANRKNIRLVDKTWSSLDLVRCLDGIVTCHGTIGLEAASLGKPVLTAYPGWYGHAGFSVSPKNRENYIEKLGRRWWVDWDADGSANSANLFAGWYFCLPDWHGRYVFNDDSEQDNNFEDLDAFFSNNRNAIDREVNFIRDWYKSGHSYYHIFKISRTRTFQTADLVDTGSSSNTPVLNAKNYPKK